MQDSKPKKFDFHICSGDKHLVSKANFQMPNKNACQLDKGSRNYQKSTQKMKSLQNKSFLCIQG